MSGQGDLGGLGQDKKLTAVVQEEIELKKLKERQTAEQELKQSQETEKAK